MKKESRYPIENSLTIFLLFAAVGGFLEAYTFLLHGGVFCNAQTGNVVLLVLRLCEKDGSGALHYAFALIAYVIGIAVSALLPRFFKRLNLPFWVALFEAAALAALAFQPTALPDRVTYISVSFLCALQYNTFTSCRSTALATTFCTNNLRQTVLNLCNGIAEKDSFQLKKSGIYALVILAFAVGAAFGAIAADSLGNYCALIGAGILLVAAVLLFLYRNKPKENTTEQSDKKVNTIDEADPKV